MAVDEQVASSTQIQALNAVVFLYRKVVEKDRYVPLPTCFSDELRLWLERRRALYEADKGHRWGCYPI